MRLRGHGASRPRPRLRAASGARARERLRGGLCSPLRLGCSGGRPPEQTPLVRIEAGERASARMTTRAATCRSTLRARGAPHCASTGATAACSSGSRWGGGWPWRTDRSDAVSALRWGGRFFRTPDGPLYRIGAAERPVTRRDPALRPHPQMGSTFGVVAERAGDVIRGTLTLVHGSTPAPASSRRGVRRRRGGAGELHGAVPEAPGGLLASTARGRLAHHPLAAGVLLGPRADALVRLGLLQPSTDGRAPRLPWPATLRRRGRTRRGGPAVAAPAGLPHLHHAAARGHPARPRSRVPRIARRPRLGDRHRLGPRARRARSLPSFGTTSMTFAGGALWFATSAGELIAAPPLTVRPFPFARAPPF